MKMKLLLAGLALALQLVNDLFAVVGILQANADLALVRGVLDDVVFVDVAFILQHLGDALANLAVADEHQPPANTIGVADAGQHVCDGIGNIKG